MQTICTSLQADNHASSSPLSFFTGRMPFLPPNQQHQSAEGIALKASALVAAEVTGICILRQCMSVCVLCLAKASVVSSSGRQMIGQRKSSSPQSAPSSPSNRPGTYMAKLAESGSVRSASGTLLRLTYVSVFKKLSHGETICPADCGGSTSVRRRIHSPHSFGGLAVPLGPTDGSRHRLMPPTVGGIKIHNCTIILSHFPVPNLSLVDCNTKKCCMPVGA